MTGVFVGADGRPCGAVGSPDQAQMLAAAQQGFMHPGYAMYGPGMMCMGAPGEHVCKGTSFDSVFCESIHVLVACKPHM